MATLYVSELAKMACQLLFGENGGAFKRRAATSYLNYEGNYSDMESILVVDDQPANLRILLETLGSLGCELLVAKSGETAVAIAKQALPDLILLDIMMPGIDGFEVCRRLKSDSATRKIPVIFLSALDGTEDKVLGLGLGAVDYVAKPFKPEEVIARVNTHLTIQRLHQEVQKRRDELEHELQAVSSLQRKLLPESLPNLDGVKLAVHYETSRYAGGDYYDVAELSDGRMAILVADAEGHSSPAAVMMAMTCVLFRSCLHSRQEPDDLIAFVNENLCKVNRESFVSAIYCVYDTQTRIMKVVRAGHANPLVYRSLENTAREIPCEGVPVMGWAPYSEVPVTEIKLEPRDRILFYTDGVTERFNEQDDLYGKSRLLRQLGTTDEDDPAAILGNIIGDIECFAGNRPADDDQAMLLIVAD